MYEKLPKHRYRKTLALLNEILPNGGVIYDLGVRNPFSEIMEKEGFKVINTDGQDLDIDYNLNIPKNVDLITGFEILEHLVSPFPLLKNLNCKKIFVTVPMNLWFSKAYRSKTDPFDARIYGINNAENYPDTLRVVMMTEEFNTWLAEKAYE